MRELPKITSAMLVVTHGCNLRCRYCFVQKEPQRMALSTAKDAARFLMANAMASGGGTPEINFFGGEPMLEFDTVIKPLVEWVHDELGEPFRFSITTNGTLLICCKSDTARIPSRPYKLFSAMRRRVIWMLTIVPVSSRGWPPCSICSRPMAMPWTTRRRSTSCLRRDVGMSAWHSKL